MTRSDWKALGILAAFSLFVLFFVSQDSYIYDLHSRDDSAWFFMCGKAWMSGLTPYVDFADSKGPLLWLIYGLGYLFHPDDYLGVFWITCIWYSLTFFFTYKVAFIFLNNSKRALSCAIMMAIAFFLPYYHNEIRSEDFCLLFMVLSLYQVCRLMYLENIPKKTIRESFSILGCCFGALLLIKYNIAVMQSIFIICALVVLVKERINWKEPFFYGLIGISASIIPFLLYFLIEGNFAAFIKEYFINTIHTVSGYNPYWNPGNLLQARVRTDSPCLSYLLEWGDLLYSPKIAILFVILVLGGLLFYKNNENYRWMPFLSSLWIFALTMVHHTGYYFSICSFLLIFFIIELMKIINSKWEKKIILVASITLMIIIPFYLLTYSFKLLIFNDNVNQKDFYMVSSVMSQVNNPKLINAYAYEHGYGILSQSLPAGKYWSRQNGMTFEMMKEHEDLILSGQADFIIIDSQNFTEKTRIQEQQLLDIGYVEYLRFGKDQTICLYSNITDLEVKNDASPSLRELFLKKTY